MARQKLIARQLIRRHEFFDSPACMWKFGRGACTLRRKPSLICFVAGNNAPVVGAA
jgi:hypothetical protein